MSDRKEFSVVRLDSNTVAYSSQYFPEELAKVIISGNVIVFAHYDGNVRIKTTECLYNNEKILIDGIKKLDPDWKKSVLSSTGDKLLRKHLQHNPMYSSPNGSFKYEQNFYKTRTPKELAAMKRAFLMGSMSR